MMDYTLSGFGKIVHQATINPTLIRCPRDGVVMRVTRCRIERLDGREPARELDRLPRGRGWRALELDVECPACARRAPGVKLVPEPSRNAQDMLPVASLAR